MLQLALTVACCHACLPTCRDLKPENFLLTAKTVDAELKLTDFGLGEHTGWSGLAFEQQRPSSLLHHCHVSCNCTPACLPAHCIAELCSTQVRLSFRSCAVASGCSCQRLLASKTLAQGLCGGCVF